jgi:hypothetical protein
MRVDATREIIRMIVDSQRSFGATKANAYEFGLNYLVDIVSSIAAHNKEVRDTLENRLKLLSRLEGRRMQIQSVQAPVVETVKTIISSGKRRGRPPGVKNKPKVAMAA